MAQHLSREIGKLERLMSELCACVEAAMRDALNCVLNHDVNAAAAIVAGDKKIDERELDIEEECLKILALHQPVAVDLRYVIACLKMNNDLERIGDLSANIAKNVLAMEKKEDASGEFEWSNLEKMMETAERMLRDCLNALFASDDKLAAKVLDSDDIVDDLNKKNHIEVAKRIAERPDSADTLLRVLTTSRNIERIADLTTNIAEDIIYMVNGEIVRHGRGTTTGG